MPGERDELLKQPAGLEASAVPKRRWGIALLLGLGVLVNYFDRVNLSVSRDADRKSTRLNSSHLVISYAVFCLKKKKSSTSRDQRRLPHIGEMYRIYIISRIYA